MGAKTGISWTDTTWNPIRGCSRVSEGCRNCYAEGYAHRFSGPGLAYEGLVQLNAAGKSTGKWNGQIKFVEEHLLDPLKWKPIRNECQACGLDHLPKDCDRELGTRPRRIFVNSMSDLFHENVTDEMRDQIFAVMALCPQHTFQILTKRPELMREYLTHPIRESLIGVQVSAIHLQRTGEPVSEWAGMPLPNAQLGVSGEDQETVTKRCWILLQTPAAVRFLSLEPMLGDVDLNAGELLCATWRKGLTIGRYLDWVIVGGESGPKARPMESEWAQGVRDQCKAAGVAFFFKQWGEWLGGMQDGQRLESGEVTLNCTDKPIRVGTKAAGFRLDNVEHHEFPAVSA